MCFNAVGNMTAQLCPPPSLTPEYARKPRFDPLTDRPPHTCCRGGYDWREERVRAGRPLSNPV